MKPSAYQTIPVFSPPRFPFSLSRSSQTRPMRDVCYHLREQPHQRQWQQQPSRISSILSPLLPFFSLSLYYSVIMTICDLPLSLPLLLSLTLLLSPPLSPLSLSLSSPSLFVLAPAERIFPRIRKKVRDVITDCQIMPKAARCCRSREREKKERGEWGILLPCAVPSPGTGSAVRTRTSQGHVHTEGGKKRKLHMSQQRERERERESSSSRRL